MAPLKTGKCATCSTEEVKLRPNPFTKDEECDNCRRTGANAVIGITDAKTKFPSFKDEDFEGLEEVKEPKPAFVGGPDHRWFLLKELEKKAPEVEKARADEREKKEAEKKEKEAAKEKSKLAKEEEKAAKAEEKAKKAAAKEAEKAEKDAEKKRKREEKAANAKPKKEKVRAAPTRAMPSRGASAKQSLKEVEEDEDEDDDEKPKKKKRVAK